MHVVQRQSRTGSGWDRRSTLIPLEAGGSAHRANRKGCGRPGVVRPAQRLARDDRVNDQQGSATARHDSGLVAGHERIVTIIGTKDTGQGQHVAGRTRDVDAIRQVGSVLAPLIHRRGAAGRHTEAGGSAGQIGQTHRLGDNGRRHNNRQDGGGAGGAAIHVGDDHIITTRIIQGRNPEEDILIAVGSGNIRPTLAPLIIEDGVAIRAYREEHRSTLVDRLAGGRDINHRRMCDRQRRWITDGIADTVGHFHGIITRVTITDGGNRERAARFTDQRQRILIPLITQGRRSVRRHREAHGVAEIGCHADRLDEDGRINHDQGSIRRHRARRVADGDGILRLVGCQHIRQGQRVAGRTGNVAAIGQQVGGRGRDLEPLIIGVGCRAFHRHGKAGRGAGIVGLTDRREAGDHRGRGMNGQGAVHILNGIVAQADADRTARHDVIITFHRSTGRAGTIQGNDADRVAGIQCSMRKFSSGKSKCRAINLVGIVCRDGQSHLADGISHGAIGIIIVARHICEGPGVVGIITGQGMRRSAHIHPGQRLVRHSRGRISRRVWQTIVSHAVCRHHDRRVRLANRIRHRAVGIIVVARHIREGPGVNGIAARRRVRRPSQV